MDCQDSQTDCTIPRIEVCHFERMSEYPDCNLDNLTDNPDSGIDITQPYKLFGHQAGQINSHTDLIDNKVDRLDNQTHEIQTARQIVFTAGQNSTQLDRPFRKPDH